MVSGLAMRDGKRDILILGSGAREHALARALASSPLAGRLFVAPGNPGCASVARTVPLNLADHAAIAAVCREEAIDLVIVGPEAPLVAGIVDDLAGEGVACFGPTRAAARLEGSKGYAKDFCREFGIPTGGYQKFRDPREAKAHVRRRGAPIVIKADGLAAGKGVAVATTLAEAEAAIDALFSGAQVRRERNSSLKNSSTARRSRSLPFATGSPRRHSRARRITSASARATPGRTPAGWAPFAAPDHDRGIKRTGDARNRHADAFAEWPRAGSPFRGVLFAGLMIGASGPKLIEFNVRFGDPEAAVILARHRGDLIPLLEACANGTLRGGAADFRPEAALAVVMAARGYPGEPLRGARIGGIADAETVPGVVVLQAGTRREGGEIVADGGRVLTITALGAESAKRAIAPTPPSTASLAGRLLPARYRLARDRARTRKVGAPGSRARARASGEITDHWCATIRTPPNISKPIQAQPRKTKENQGKPRKKSLGFPWIFLDSLVRIRTFQWLTAIPKKKSLDRASQ